MSTEHPSTTRVVNEYLERKGVWKLMRSMLRAVTLDAPEDPLEFLVEFLEHWPLRPHVLLMAPTHQQAQGYAEMLHDKLGLVIVDATKTDARSLLARRVAFSRVIMVEDPDATTVDETANKIAVVFKNRLTKLNCTTNTNEFRQQLIAAASDVTSNAYRDPKLPARVILLGGSARVCTGQAKALAKAMDLKYLKVDELIVELLEAGQHSRLAEEILEQRRRNPKKPLPDSKLVEVVMNEISDEAVDAQGWVLDGFPLNANQALLLRSAAGQCYEPNRAVVLSDDANVTPLDLSQFYDDIALEIDCTVAEDKCAVTPIALHHQIVSFVAGADPRLS